MLSIRNLHATVEGTPILNGIDLDVNPGEVHAIMGPNGSGKSTLAQVLAGHDAYEVTQGEILFNGENLLEMEVEERAWAGLFLAFQYPVEIPGVSNIQFLKTAVNNQRKARGESELDAVSFMKMAKECAKQVDLSPDFLKRGVNEGFSGGEKKRNELMQMLLLKPRLGVLDETDSGLDIDALKVVADGVNSLRAENRSFIVVTHYQRLLNHIVPDVVHVLSGGKIVKTGDKSLALQLEEYGYGEFGIDEQAAG
ncbi:MAG: Fe-S cluster assembly ATPase SufC [Oleiphilaceae bacterium]|nr:Fe-S cluster assembly ATPase SufC [Oleiphilaceae bacterium]